MRPPRIGPRTVAAAALTGGAAALALERRHLRALGRDADLARLTAPLAGESLDVRSVDGTILHAEIFGRVDGHTVVLAHGWTEQLSFWGPVIDRLGQQDLRLVAYDLRGHGASRPAASGDYSLDRFGDDLQAVLGATLGDGQRATLVGHSLGAMSIAAWARRHEAGARARAAALVNTGLGDLISGHRLFGELASRWLNNPWAGRTVVGSRAPLPGFSSPLAHAIIRHAAFGPSATAGEVAFYERMLLTCPPRVRAACAQAMFEMDLWEAVTRLTVPTLVITGTSDRLTPPAHGRRIAEALPQLAGLLELPDTGHMSPIERPDDIARAVAELVFETQAAATPV